MRRIRIRFDDLEAEAVLLEDLAPRITSALWEHLPMRDRAIGARWSGDLWRSEGDHDLGTGNLIENEAGMLGAGDIIYYADPGVRCRLGFAWAAAQWMAPLWKPQRVSLIGRVDRGFEALVKRSGRLGNEGPRVFEITRA